jgi:flavin reductase (DIM6/NTAB) family NADH-FMN oxidoreductase RutF
MVSPESLRQVMANFPTGVAVVSSLEPDGSIHGMTANSFTSVSLDPPLVLVCIGYQRQTYGNVRRLGRFGINLLAERQRGIAEYYALDAQDRTGDVDVSWDLTVDGSPRMHGALAFLGCRVVAQHDHGDHAIFVAEVQKTATEAGQPLLFYSMHLLDKAWY